MSCEVMYWHRPVLTRPTCPCVFLPACLFCLSQPFCMLSRSTPAPTLAPCPALSLTSCCTLCTSCTSCTSLLSLHGSPTPCLQHDTLRAKGQLPGPGDHKRARKLAAAAQQAAAAADAAARAQARARAGADGQGPAANEGNRGSAAPGGTDDSPVPGSALGAAPAPPMTLLILEQALQVRVAPSTCSAWL